MTIEQIRTSVHYYNGTRQGYQCTVFAIVDGVEVDAYQVASSAREAYRKAMSVCRRIVRGWHNG